MDVRRTVKVIGPVVAVAALATSCLKVEITSDLVSTAEPGEPVRVCARVHVSDPAHEGWTEGAYEFHWDSTGVGTADDAVPTLIDQDVEKGTVCGWHVYRHAGTYRPVVGYQAVDAWGDPAARAVPAGVTVQVVDPPDPQPFLTGYPLDASTWAFSYRNRWFTDPTVASAVDLSWTVTDGAGVAVVPPATGTDLTVAFPGPGTYTVTVTAGKHLFDDVGTIVTTTDRRTVTVG